MILTDKTKDDFEKWFKENYSYASHESFSNGKEFDRFLLSNEIHKYALIMVFFDRFRDLGKGKTLQSIIKKTLKDYESAMSWFELQTLIIEKANNLYNVKFSQADA